MSQYSIAYEKACVIFNIAATCSSIAALQNRFDPNGLKVAFNYFQCAAGLFVYINENFLHAPSLDLSRDSIKVLVSNFYFFPWVEIYALHYSKGGFVPCTGTRMFY